MVFFIILVISPSSTNLDNVNCVFHAVFVLIFISLLSIEFQFYKVIFGNWFGNVRDFSIVDDLNIYFGPLNLSFVLPEYYWHFITSTNVW